MEKTLAFSVLSNWHEMSRPLRLTAVFGIVSVVWLIIAACDMAIESSRLLPSLFLFSFLLDAPVAIALNTGIIGVLFFIVGPVVGFMGALLLLLHSMTVEQKGVLGFISLLCSLPTVLLLLSYGIGLPLYLSGLLHWFQGVMA